MPLPGVRKRKRLLSGDDYFRGTGLGALLGAHDIDSGDKIPADKKAAIEAAVAKLKDAHKAQDIDGIEKAIKEIETTFGAAQQDILNAQQQAGANPGAGAPGAGPSNAGAPGPDDHVQDVDFEEVK